MYEVRLNGSEIKEPQGLADLVLSRGRSDVYGGFVSGEYGYIRDIGGLTFADPESREIIAAETNAGAIVTVEILYCEKLIFSGKLDVSSMSISDCCYYRAEVIRGEDADAFQSRKDITYALEPTFKIRLPKKEYLTGGSYVLGDNNTFSSQTVTGMPMDIGVPLKPDNKDSSSPGVSGQVESSTNQGSGTPERPNEGPAGPQGPIGPKGNDGETPYIGENGNWWIGDTDTGVSATTDGIWSKDGSGNIYRSTGGVMVGKDTYGGMADLEVFGKIQQDFVKGSMVRTDGNGVFYSAVAQVDYMSMAHPASVITTPNITNWNEAYNLRHTHANKAVLDGITAGKVLNWDDAYTMRHSHANKSILDAIEQPFTTVLKDKLDGIQVNANNYVLPIASASVLGGVKIGANLNINAGTGVLDAIDTTYSGSTSIALVGTSFQRAALTGDVTAAQDSNTLTITAGVVTNAKMANMISGTIKGRTTGTGSPEDLTATQVRTILNVADGANNYVHPTGDGNLHVPATGTSNAGKFLKAGAIAASIFWASIVKADITDFAHTHPISDITGLQTALDGKAPISHTHLWAQITDKPNSGNYIFNQNASAQAGNLWVSGLIKTTSGLEVGYQSSSGGESIGIGRGRTANAYSYIDFVGDTVYTTYGLRILRGNIGENSPSSINHRGTGTFTIINQDAAALTFATSGSNRVYIQPSGNVLIGTGSESGLAKLQVNGSIQQSLANSLLGANANGVISAATSAQVNALISWSYIQNQMTAAQSATLWITGTISTRGMLNVGRAVATESALLRLGAERTDIGYAYIDMIGDTTYPDFGLRLIRGNTGANTSSQLIHRGIGDFMIRAQEAATIKMRTSDADRLVIYGNGDVVINSGTNSGLAKLQVNGAIQQSAKNTLLKGDTNGVISAASAADVNTFLGGYIPLGQANAVTKAGEAADFATISKGTYAIGLNVGGTTNAPAGYAAGALLSIGTPDLYGGQIILGRDPECSYIRGFAAGNYSSWIRIASREWTIANFAPLTRSVIAGTGLTGGGTLSADRTLAFNTAWGDARYALKGEVPTDYVTRTTYQVITARKDFETSGQIATFRSLDASGNYITFKHHGSGDLGYIGNDGGGALGGYDGTGFAIKAAARLHLAGGSDGVYVHAGLTSAILKLDANKKLVAAVEGIDYVAPSTISGYVLKTGDVMSGRLQAYRSTGGTLANHYSSLQIEVGDNDYAGINFHKLGISAVSLYHNTYSTLTLWNGNVSSNWAVGAGDLYGTQNHNHRTDAEINAWVTSQGYLTGNQAITLSGAVTGSGTTTISTTMSDNVVTTAKVANSNVTFAKVQNITSARILGRYSAGAGVMQEITLGSGLTLNASTGVLDVSAAAGGFVQNQSASAQVASYWINGTGEIGGDFTVGKAQGVQNSNLYVGKDRTGDGNAAFSLKSSSVSTNNFDFRITRGAGASGNVLFENKSNGGYQFHDEGGGFVFTILGLASPLSISGINGNIGINQTPHASYRLYVFTTSDTGEGLYVRGKGWFTGGVTFRSDERLKTSISPIDSPLEKIDMISGNLYLYGGKLTYGVLAGEIKKILPWAVSADNMGYLGVDYNAIHALTIESIKALNKKGDERDEKIKKLEEDIQQLKQKIGYAGANS